MDQDIKEIRAELKRLADLTQDNHRILRGIQRQGHISTFLSIIKWIVIIAATIGALYYIQPYFDQITKVYEQVSGSKIDFGSVPAWLKYF